MRFKDNLGKSHLPPLSCYHLYLFASWCTWSLDFITSTVVIDTRTRLYITKSWTIVNHPSLTTCLILFYITWESISYIFSAVKFVRLLSFFFTKVMLYIIHLIWLCCNLNNSISLQELSLVSDRKCYYWNYLCFIIPTCVCRVVLSIFGLLYLWVRVFL